MHGRISRLRMPGMPASLADPTQSDSTWKSRFFWLLAAVVVVRGLFLVFFVQDTDLAGDEAYYWDWGRRLDWGYYSKPPMIGWLNAITGFLSGNTEWGPRLGALLLGTLSLVVAWLFTRALFGVRTAFWAALLVVCTPANGALSLFFTIDAPLVLLWTLGLWLFWRAAESPQAWGRWILLGLVLGLGVLSKQMMLVFPVLMLVWAALSPADRGLLRRPGLWLAVVIEFVFLVPVLIWNARHHWITVQHTAHHFDDNSHSLGDYIVTFFQFPGLQAAVYSPVTWVMVVVVLWQLTPRWRSVSRSVLLLLVFSVPVLVVFTLLAMRQEINPNWPAVFYIPGFVLAAAWFEGQITGEIAPRWKKWSLWVGCVFSAAVYVLALAIPAVGWKGHNTLDPFAFLRGWKDMGAEVGTYLSKVPRPDKTFIVVLGHRYNAAEMAFYIPGQPTTFRWEPDGKIMSQYEIWPAPTDRIGWDALIVYPDSEKGKLELSYFIRRFFASYEKQGDVHIDIGHGRALDSQIFFCADMKEWPPSKPEQMERDPAMKARMESKEGVKP